MAILFNGVGRELRITIDPARLILSPFHSDTFHSTVTDRTLFYRGATSISSQ